MTIVDSAPHRELAKAAAVHGLILLKNIDHTLPLAGTGMTAAPASPISALKVAVIGPNANRSLTLASSYAGCKARAGGPLLPSCTFVTPLQGIEAAVKKSTKFDSEVCTDLFV